MHKKIIILQRILPHYRTGFFKRLKAIYPSLKVLYGNPFKREVLKNADKLDSDIFQKTSNYYFQKEGKVFFSSIYKILIKEKPDIVVSVFNVGNLNLYFLFLLRSLLKFKLVLWSLGYDHLTGFDPGKNFLHKIRLILSQKADAVIFYWKYGKDVVEKFSKKKSHYFVAQNTIDTTMHFDLKSKFDMLGKDKIKKELGIEDKINFIYIGRLVPDKEVDVLLKAYSLFEKKYGDCRLTIIGDGPEREKLEYLKSNHEITGAFFLGEILDVETTGKWLYISDALIMPGRLGNSVVHSFCYGTPVISTNKGEFFHCEGISYLKEGVNGFLANDRDPDDLCDKMYKLISDEEQLINLRKNAFKTAKEECSLEKMLEGFREAIEVTGKDIKS